MRVQCNNGGMLSACLLSWRRPDNVRRIVRALEELPCIGEVLVWNNDPSVELRLPGSKARVIASPTNAMCLGRYSCASEAAFPLVYVQDDDVLVEDIPELLSQFQSDPTRIHFNLNALHYARRARQVYGQCHSALIGWGAIFHKSWLSVLDEVPPRVRTTALYRREADQYFTMLQRRLHAPRLGAFTQLEGHSSSDALWIASEHDQMRALAVHEVLGLVRQNICPSAPPLWHVVIVAHNDACRVQESIDSVLLNKADYELTIVDDGSTDGTPLLVRQLATKYAHVRALVNKTRLGMSSALNRGIASRESRFVVAFDAADRLGRSYLVEAGSVLCDGADIANPDATIVGAEALQWPAPPETTLPLLLRHNSIHYSAAFRRHWWVTLGGFDEDLAGWEHYDFWIRAVAHGALVKSVPGHHFYYRRHTGPESTRSRDSSAAVRDALVSKHRNTFEDHDVRS